MYLATTMNPRGRHAHGAALGGSPTTLVFHMCALRCIVMTEDERQMLRRGPAEARPRRAEGASFEQFEHGPKQRQSTVSMSQTLKPYASHWPMRI